MDSRVLYRWQGPAALAMATNTGPASASTGSRILHLPRLRSRLKDYRISHCQDKQAPCEGSRWRFWILSRGCKMIELSSRTIPEGRRWLRLCTRQACLSALRIWTPFLAGADSLGGGLSSCNAPSVQESTQTQDIDQGSDESLRLTSPTNHASAES